MTTFAPPDAVEPPPPRRSSVVGRVITLSVLALSAGAVVFTGALLFHNATPAAETVVVVPPGPQSFTAAEVGAAKQKACGAWDSASSAMAQTSNALANTPKNWDDPATMAAAGRDVRTTLVESAYLRAQVDPAAPPGISGAIHDYLVATFDQQDANVRHRGSEADAAVDRINAAVDKVNAACGLK